MDREGTIKLLQCILADTVRLPGANCVGKHELFDPIVGNGRRFQRAEQVRLAEAARVCAGCTVIQHCPSVTTTAEAA